MIYRTDHRKRRSGSGQAIAEMAVCLVAILAVVGGFLLITALGLENVQNAIRTREAVDQRARDGITTSSGRLIRTWNYGTDGILFTRDDAAAGWSPVEDVFLSELKDDTEPLDMKDSSVFPHISPQNNFAATLSRGKLFLAAADLSSAKVTESDPLSKRNLSSFKNLIKALISNADFSLEDSAFMPSSPVMSE